MTGETHTDKILEDDVDSDLEESEHTQLVELISRYRGIVATNVQQMGKTTGTEMAIELSTERPICYRPIDFHMTRKNK